MQKGTELLKDIVKERKIKYLGHILRGDSYKILRLIIEGKVAGNRSISCRQNSWAKVLKRWQGKFIGNCVFMNAFNNLKQIEQNQNELAQNSNRRKYRDNI